MSHTIVAYTVKPGREQENAALVRAIARRVPPASSRMTTAQPGRTSAAPPPGAIVPRRPTA